MGDENKRGAARPPGDESGQTPPRGRLWTRGRRLVRRVSLLRRKDPLVWDENSGEVTLKEALLLAREELRELRAETEELKKGRPDDILRRLHGLEEVVFGTLSRLPSGGIERNDDGLWERTRQLEGSLAAMEGNLHQAPKDADAPADILPTDDDDDDEDYDRLEGAPV